MIDSVIVYNLLTKRRTYLNIILASPAGTIPVLGGWSAVKDISLDPVIMAITVTVWTPIHVWSIVLRWKSDYLNAKIPMLPLVVSGSKLIACSSLLLIVFTSITLPPLMRFWSPAYIIIILLNAALLALSLWLMLGPTAKKEWILFKFTAPYIAVIFTLWFLSAIFGAAGSVC